MTFSTVRMGGWLIFLSLKWKVLLVLSVVLLAISASFSLLSYQSLTDLFEKQRREQRDSQRDEINALIEQSETILFQLGTLIPALEGAYSALKVGNRQQFEASFEDHWNYLSLDMGIVSTEIYLQQNGFRSRWGEPIKTRLLQESVKALLRSVRDTERPTSFIECEQNCIHYAIVPMMVAGEHVGEVLLGRSLADTIIQFQQITGNDVGVLAQVVEGAEPPAARRRLQTWGVDIRAMTHEQRNVPLLIDLQQRLPLFEQLAQGGRFQLGSRHLEVQLIPITKNFHHAEDFFVVITDISAQMNHIEAAARKNLQAGLLGLLISELVLLSVLWHPINRLHAVAGKLPLLAQGKFAEVREALSAHRRRFNDEIDVLSGASYKLSHQLENLTKQIEEREARLHRHNQALEVERDFVKGLLDTAQVIILTQSSRGQLMMSNSYTESLLGFSAQELAKKRFIDLHHEDELLTDMLGQLTKLRRKGRVKIRHEGQVVCKSGELKHILWSHVKLKYKKPNQEVLSIGLDITEIKSVESRIAWLSDHDPLTNMFNRRRFQEELGKELAWARRADKSGALLYLDLDNFKDINDSGGHHSGDVLLKSVADVLTKIVREVDVIGDGVMGRLGGDEFGLILRDIDERGVTEVVERLRQRLSEIKHMVDGHLYTVTSSIGITLFPQHGEDVHMLLANADLAMYQAKALSTGAWYLFSEDDQVRERLQERLLWRRRIEEALEEERLVLFYQPILDIQNRTISHYEALLRMRTAEGEVVPPSLFIPVAEEVGLIPMIDRYVLRHAIRQQVELCRQRGDITIAINLSGRAFEDPDLLGFIREQIDQSGADPRRLIFEITETAAVADIPAARRLMRKIRELGAQFALDDFGVGFSSFYYLKELPVDYVKIDGAFIRDLPDNKDNQVFVRALSDVARGFGKKTIAEYVDGDETLRLLEQFHVGYAQGYYIGKPAAEITAPPANKPTALS